MQTHEDQANDSPRERAVPGTHANAVRVCVREVPPGPDVRALDVGAGEGALSRRLLDAGYAVEACELFPEQFRIPDVKCVRVDLNEPWPHEDNSFDLIVAVEVVEHIEDHMCMFREAGRVLKPGGAFIFTTPNILSLKSRLRFLFSGYFYSFGPISQDHLSESDHRPHVSPFTADRYRHVLGLCGLELAAIDTDRFQSTSRAWGWLAPIIRAHVKRKYGNGPDVVMQNSAPALFGRGLVGIARKRAQ